jgi:hypothetical protein
MGNVMDLARLPGSLFADAETFDTAIQAVNLLLETIAPNGNPAVWTRLKKAEELADDYPEVPASVVLGAIADPDQEEIAGLPLIPVIRNLLGDDLVARLRHRLDLPLADRKKIER